MDWLNNLFFGSGIAHNVAIFALVICIGVALGKIKFAGISLGVTMVLFVGIAASHFGMLIDDEHVLHFAKEFGLILFVFAIGLQVGPSFFSSFKKGGLQMNLLALGIVFTGVFVCWVLHYITKTPMSTMVGILSGAVTNTPGLGAATQTYLDINKASDPTISLGYAVSYPMGVIGVISVMILIRYIFGINMEKEEQSVQQNGNKAVDACRLSLEICNPSIAGRQIPELRALIGKNFVISRVCGSDEKILVPDPEVRLNVGDKILLITAEKDAEALTAFFGKKIDMSWDRLKAYMAAARILVTNGSVNGKSLGKLGLYDGLGFNVTRVNRAGIDLIAHADLEVQIGDRVTVVGSESAIKNIEKLLGNSLTNLRHPNIIPIFLGIFLGMLVGSVPILIPGIPQAVKLGLAGGPLVVAILLGRFGYKLKLATYTTASANLMLREIGIALFLAGVGLGAGKNFLETVVHGGGYIWIFYGMTITVIPMLLAGIVGRTFFKFDYFTLIGVMSGSCTNPPALAYSSSTTHNDRPAVGYSTVYPLTMFMRVLTAQLLIIFFAS